MAKMLPKRTLEEIRFANDIVEVISSYLTLKKSGATYKACCPFHKEKTPSFHVNPQRQICHCFGCGEGGDVFSFVQKYEGVDFMTAVSMLAQRAGIAVEFDDDGTDDGGIKKDVLFKLHEQLTQFFQRCLTQVKGAEHARQYLKSRDFTPELIEDFKVGYAPKGWDNMLKWGEKNKFSMAELEAAGVILKPSKPDAKVQFYDRFRDRLMFPISDVQGRVIGFSARLLDKDPKQAKYVNSPETALFHKSRILYALDKARRPIVNADQRQAIVCEGQIDVIRCHAAGFDTAVAAQGTAFTESHAQILKRYADSVVLVFDTDKAGQDAAIKAAQIFIQQGLAVRVAQLPGDTDPDSFIREKGAEAFGRIIDSAVSAVGFQFDVLSERENTDSVVGAMRASNAVLETVSMSASSVQRAKLMQEAAERLNVPVTALQEDLKKLKRPRVREAPAEAAAPKAPVNRPVEEVQLCEHLVHTVDFPELGELVSKYLPLEMISDRCCRQLAEAALNSMKTGRTILDEAREFVDTTGELPVFLAGILEAPAKVLGSEFSRTEAVRDIILKIWRREKEAERTRLEQSQDKQDQLHATELTMLLPKFKTWEDGAEIIEIELDLDD
ncbi:DNA primase [bacterium E08(2017)]|nr:DNA primase [bacterium E08(2017)]